MNARPSTTARMLCTEQLERSASAAADKFSSLLVDELNEEVKQVGACRARKWLIRDALQTLPCYAFTCFRLDETQQALFICDAPALATSGLAVICACHLLQIYDTQKVLERESQLLKQELAAATQQLTTWSSKTQVCELACIGFASDTVTLYSCIGNNRADVA